MKFTNLCFITISFASAVMALDLKEDEDWIDPVMEDIVRGFIVPPSKIKGARKPIRDLGIKALRKPDPATLKTGGPNNIVYSQVPFRRSRPDNIKLHPIKKLKRRIPGKSKNPNDPDGPRLPRDPENPDIPKVPKDPKDPKNPKDPKDPDEKPVLPPFNKQTVALMAVTAASTLLIAALFIFIGKLIYETCKNSNRGYISIDSDSALPRYHRGGHTDRRHVHVPQAVSNAVGKSKEAFEKSKQNISSAVQKGREKISGSSSAAKTDKAVKTDKTVKPDKPDKTVKTDTTVKPDQPKK